MKILLFASAYNSMTQRFHVELVDLGHEVSIELALDHERMRQAVDLFQPDVIVAPFLKTAIPEDIWKQHLCIIIHPGIKGDRGPSSIDWAILEDESEWGVTALQADAEMDAGDIWASINFPLEGETKSDLYRGKGAQAAIACIKQTLANFIEPKYQPEPLDYGNPDVKGTWRNPLKQSHRAISWESDTTAEIVRKIRSADSQPGLLDVLFGEQFYLYGAHPENVLTGKPGELIAQRYGAICRATIDGAVWITHLKRKKKGEQVYFKLPAAQVLREYIQALPEVPVSLELSPHEVTFRDIWYEEKNQVGYLHFPFYNGAMSTEQCQRLRNAYLYARTKDTKVIVLMGGEGFWSNGIHLNVVEASADPAAESWQNINAINDFVYEVLRTDTHLVISAMQGNGAAGGVMMALAADKVFAREGIVLNPHYKRMGLYGSEYWTYSLPRRVGPEMAQKLTSVCMPMGTRVAKSIGLIDNYFGHTVSDFRTQVIKGAESLAQGEDFQHILWLKNKQRFLDEQYKPLAIYRQEELEQMKLDFTSNAYNTARYNFIYKISPSETPLHLAVHRQQVKDNIPCKLLSPA
ncbi:hydrogenase maturation protein [Acaryochloris sp. IP29b_bin.148]|uniref:hydrogenase maturation protein n=1 Tax=Acaryochloris sp. IP29b_bin.148 TaxID=2969218 RepID=UPI00262DCA63|nr:hydrogenase maturation protein [Acaryochloris sp. IP29b_bin.148]